MCLLFHDETTEGRPMSLQDIASLGKMLAQFLALFADCFVGVKGQRLLAIYVRGLLSDIGRKNVETIALKQNVSPRTLQRFLESIKWDHAQVLRRCRQIIAAEHADSRAIGVIDETGTAKSGSHTVGVKRQYNGNRGKVENCVNHVALAYSSPGFDCLLDAQLYLPKEWTDDLERRKKTTSPTTLFSRPSPSSRWISLIEQNVTESRSWPGRPTSCTGAMVPFWMVWTNGLKPSSWRFRPTHTFGPGSQKY